MHFVFTVCDDAAQEVCPVWPGQPVTAHWGLPDPAAHTGTDAARRQAFRATFESLDARIKLLTSLPIDKLDRLALQRALRTTATADAETPAETPQR
jgi:arsenate reductase